MEEETDSFDGSLSIEDFEHSSKDNSNSTGNKPTISSQVAQGIFLQNNSLKKSAPKKRTVTVKKEEANIKKDCMA